MSTSRAIPREIRRTASRKRRPVCALSFLGRDFFRVSVAGSLQGKFTPIDHRSATNQEPLFSARETYEDRERKKWWLQNGLAGLMVAISSGYSESRSFFKIRSTPTRIRPNQNSVHGETFSRSKHVPVQRLNQSTARSISLKLIGWMASSQ